MTLQRTSEEFVSAWFDMHPQRATEKGFPGHDADTPDYSERRVRQFLNRLDSLDEQLRDSDPDTRLLKSHLEGARRPFQPEQDLQTNPTFYIQAGLDGIESLRMRHEEPPWEALASRLEGLEQLVDSAVNQLESPSTPSVEVAKEMVREAAEEFQASFAAETAPAFVVRAAERAQRSLKRFGSWLESCPSRAFAPMGEDAFSALLAGENLLERDWPAWQTLARQALGEVEQQLAHLPAVHPLPSDWRWSREQVWDYFESELDRVRQFVERLNIVSIPEGELRLTQTPPYLATLIPGAHYLEPAVFSGDRVGRFFLPPMPQEWTPEVQRRFALRRARGGFANLVVHEAWPGHHLQFLHAAAHHHPLRNVRDNDVMLEGWALYCEELLESKGLYGSTPFRPRLESLKMRLVRVLVDIGIHTGQMTLAQAEEFMGGQLGVPGSQWVRSEVRRYALEPGQAMSYWVGATLIKELRAELQITEGSEKAFHDALLKQGPIPLPLIRRRLLEKEF